MILKLRQSLRKKSVFGFTLTELAIVMGIMGMITGAIWYATNNAHEAQKQGDALVELQTVTQNIANIYSGQKLPAGSVNGLGFTTLTDAMIRGKEIPSVYVNALTNTGTPGGMLADNPWYPTGFVVYAGATNTQYHISVMNVTMGGCLALLVRGTSCHIGQMGCPFKVATNCPGGTCPGGNTITPTAGTDWFSNMTLTGNATALCKNNIYPGVGTTNSVDFFYSL